MVPRFHSFGRHTHGPATCKGNADIEWRACCYWLSTHYHLYVAPHLASAGIGTWIARVSVVRVVLNTGTFRKRCLHPGDTSRHGDQRYVCVSPGGRGVQWLPRGGERFRGLLRTFPGKCPRILVGSVTRARSSCLAHWCSFVRIRSHCVSSCTSFR